MQRLVIAVALMASPLAAQDPKPNWTPEQKKLVDEAQTLTTEGTKLRQQRRTDEAVAKFRRILAIREKLYPIAEYPIGHIEIASGLYNLAVVLEETGASDEAIRYFEQALSMRRKLYPAERFPNGHEELLDSIESVGSAWATAGHPLKAVPFHEEALAMAKKLYRPPQFIFGHPNIARSLNNLAFAWDVAGAPEKALPLFEQVLTMYRFFRPKAIYPNGHADIARSLNNLGGALRSMGAYERSLARFEEALAVLRAIYPPSQFPDGHPELARGINNVASAQRAVGAVEKAIAAYEQALAMSQRLFKEANFPLGHPIVALALNNLGTAYFTMGSGEKALPYLEQALAITQKLYPQSKYPSGHPDVVRSLNNIAICLENIGEPDKALPYHERALAFRRLLYPAATFPDGHNDLAQGLNNLAAVHRVLGNMDKALAFAGEALAMYRKVYPKSQYPLGHPLIATCLHNVGVIHGEMQQVARSLEHLNQARDMRAKLYPPDQFPDGHPEMTASIVNIALALERSGAIDKAAEQYRLASGMMTKLAQRAIRVSSESEALAYLQSLPRVRDSHLSVSRDLEQQAGTYRVIWDDKAQLTRWMEERQAIAQTAGTDAAAKLTRLKEIRRRMEQLMQSNDENPAERDRLLREFGNERDSIERTLGQLLPWRDRRHQRDQLGPDDLQKALPANTVFIDCVHYSRFAWETDSQGKRREFEIPCYVAFVIAPGRPVTRIELGESRPIDRAIAAWRTAIDAGKPSPAADELARLLWSPIAKAIPPRHTSIYIAPDGDLSRLPWAALPADPQDSKSGRVLLEDLEIAVVPHGPYLLEQLKYPRRLDGADSALIVGGIEYGDKWTALPGTKLEMDAVAGLAPPNRHIASRTEVTSELIGKHIVKVRHAHFATHGFFDAETLAKEKKREESAMKNRQFGEDSRRVISKNPLGFVGLVLSKGEIMSGLSILDFPLENLRLATLSACETGLGEYTGGKGVENLQMAFHVAGCPNVIASLWKVNDAATAALMKKLYHELWVNKKPPLAALREAQLFIFYHPDLIPDVLGERGAPKATEALAVKSAKNGSAPRMGRADTKLWAAFVLSGVGR